MGQPTESDRSQTKRAANDLNVRVYGKSEEIDDGTI